MCGSGTPLIEAAQYAARIAPGLARQQWGFSHWKGHDIPTWLGLLDEARQSQERHSHAIDDMHFLPGSGRLCD